MLLEYKIRHLDGLLVGLKLLLVKIYSTNCSMVQSSFYFCIMT